MTSNAEIAQKLTAACNAHDQAAMEAVLAENCHFESARLPIVADGRTGVAESLISWLDLHKEWELKIVREFYAGDEGFNEWRFVATKLDGEQIETHGVDYLRFEDGLIAEKNSFRKFLF